MVVPVVTQSKIHIQVYISGIAAILTATLQNQESGNDGDLRSLVLVEETTTRFGI